MALFILGKTFLHKSLHWVKKNNFRLENILFITDNCIRSDLYKICASKVNDRLRSGQLWYFRHLTTLVFVSTFVYLMFVRYLHLLFDVNEFASQANGVQLLITLRVVNFIHFLQTFFPISRRSVWLSKCQMLVVTRRIQTNFGKESDSSQMSHRFSTFSTISTTFVDYLLVKVSVFNIFLSCLIRTILFVSNAGWFIWAGFAQVVVAYGRNSSSCHSTLLVCTAIYSVQQNVPTWCNTSLIKLSAIWLLGPSKWFRLGHVVHRTNDLCCCSIRRISNEGLQVAIIQLSNSQWQSI